MPKSRPIGRLVKNSYLLDAFGEVWGKLSITGEEAEKLVGFKPKDGAIGIVLSRCWYTDKSGIRRKGIFVKSLTKHKHPYTKKLLFSKMRCGVIHKIAGLYLTKLIYPIWGIPDSRRAFSSFVTANMRKVGLPPDCSKLQLSIGTLPAPKSIRGVFYDDERNEIWINVPVEVRIGKRVLSQKNKRGIGFLDRVTGSFLLIAPEDLKPAKLTWEIEKIDKYDKIINIRSKRRFYVYMYNKLGDKYSNSIATEIKLKPVPPEKSKILQILIHYK